MTLILHTQQKENPGKKKQKRGKERKRKRKSLGNKGALGNAGVSKQQLVSAWEKQFVRKHVQKKTILTPMKGVFVQ